MDKFTSLKEGLSMQNILINRLITKKNKHALINPAPGMSDPKIEKTFLV